MHLISLRLSDVQVGVVVAGVSVLVISWAGLLPVLPSEFVCVAKPVVNSGHPTKHCVHQTIVDQ